MTGALYLLYFLTAILAQFLVDRGFALSGNVTNVIATMCYLIVTFLFYGLFKPVSGSLSLLAALFSLAGCVVMTFGLFHVASSPISSLLFFGHYSLLIWSSCCWACGCLRADLFGCDSLRRRSSGLRIFPVASYCVFSSFASRSVSYSALKRELPANGLDLWVPTEELNEMPGHFGAEARYCDHDNLLSINW
jgi:hypothetical protein